MNPTRWMLRLRAWLREESGQATTEYMLVTVMLFAGLTLLATPFSTDPLIAMPIKGLQKYVDFAFYCIDTALN